MIKLILAILIIHLHLVKSSDDDFEKQIQDYESEAHTIKDADGQNKVLNRTQMNQYIQNVYKYGDSMAALALEIGLRKSIFLRKHPNYIKEFEEKILHNVSLRDLPLGYEASGPGTWWDFVYNTPEQIQEPKCHSIYMYPNNVMLIDFNCPITALNRPRETACCEYAYKGLTTQYCCEPFERFFQGTRFRTTIAIGFLFSVFLVVFLSMKLGDFIAKKRRNRDGLIERKE